MRGLPRGAAAAGLLATALVIAAPASSLVAQRSILFEELSSEIHVLSDGDIVVTETLRPRFSGTWNGVERRLDLRPPSSYGQGHLLRLTVMGATDEQGRRLRVEDDPVDVDTRRIRVWVPNATDRAATVVLRYRVGDALGFFEPDSATGLTMDELYWQVTGTDWDVPILAASARVVLPGGARPVQATGYVGRASSAQQVPVRLEEGAVAVSAGERLDPGEGLTVAVGWPAGAVTRPDGVVGVGGAQSDGGGAVGPGAGGSAGVLGSVRAVGPGAFWPLLLPFAVFWVAYRAWARRGRDPSERAIAVQWEPPAELSPAEVGTLVDHGADMHDIIPTLVDLAVRGVVVIEEREKPGLLSFGKDYAFHLMKPASEWTGLAEHEVAFLNGLFNVSTRREALDGMVRLGGVIGALADTMTGTPATEGAPAGAVDSVLLSDLKNAFYKSIPGIKNAVYRSLVLKGHYLRRPDKVRNRWVLSAAITFFVAFAATSFADVIGTAGGAVTAVALLAAGGISALILAIFGALMPARTETGARARESALGFRRFLERVESPRYRRMIRSPDQFEQYLPFAMAFKCEETWARAFEDLVTQPPDWYRGRHYGAFRPTAFASDMGTLSTAARSTLSSSPSSSGSGGGGSVGGGGGGGGGGGF